MTVDAAILEEEAALAFGESVGEELDDNGTSADALGEEGQFAGGNESLTVNAVAAPIEKAAAEENRPDENETPKDPKKVKLKKTITDRIRQLNAEANLPAPIRLGAVAVPLAALDEATALDVLDSMLEEREGDGDPTAWIVVTAKQRCLWKAWEKEQWEEWQATEEAGAADRGAVLDPKVLEKIRQLNQGGALTEPLRASLIAGPLSLISVPVALKLLCELESRGAEIDHPSGFVRGIALKKTGKVMAQVDSLNKGGAGRMDLINPLDPARVQRHLQLVSEEVGLELLQKLEASAMDIEQPTEWLITAVGLRARPVAKQLLRVLESTSLVDLNPSRVLSILDPIAESDALAILKRLESSADNLRSPYGWLNAQIKGKGKINGKANGKSKGKGKDKNKTKSKVTGKGKGSAGNCTVAKEVSKDDDWSEDGDDLVVQPKAGRSNVRQPMREQPKTKRAKLELVSKDEVEEDWPELEEEHDEEATFEEERLCGQTVEDDGRTVRASTLIANEAEAAGDCLDYADGEEDEE